MKQIIVLSFVFIFSLSRLFAQLNQPLSFYGFGEKVSNNNIVNVNMGGISAAYYDYNTINSQNPASYGFARNAYTRFVMLDMGSNINYQSLTNSKNNNTTNNAYAPISYIRIGIPIKRKMGLVFGLQPLQTSSYNIIEKVGKSQISNALIDSLHNTYNGSGSTYNVFAGLGWMVHKNLSIGVNVGFVWGNKTQQIFTLPQVTTYPTLSFISTDKKNYSGVSIHTGVQYQKSLTSFKEGQNIYMKLGAYHQVVPLFSANNSFLQTNYNTNSSTTTTDTISYYTSKLSLSYPSTFGIGILFERDFHWLIGIDAEFTSKPDYGSVKQNNYLTNAWVLKLGGQYIPNYNGRQILSRMPYRMGGFIQKNQNQFSSQDVLTWGVSIGTGIMFKRYSYTNQNTIVNIGVEYISKSNDNNFYKENFININIGFSLSDLWFLKPKYQ